MDPLEPLMFILILALWPVVGQIILTLVNRAMLARGQPAPIPAASDGGEILMRMYLWPVVLIKYLSQR